MIERYSVQVSFNVVTVGIRLTGQCADKPTRSESSRGLVNSRTSQLADSEFFNHGQIIIYETKT